MHRRSWICFCTVVGFLGSAVLAGCSGSFHVEPVAVPAAGSGIHGNVHGGQSPISGSAVYFFAASTAGYGTANQSLLKTTAAGVLTDGSGLGYVKTDGSGTFSISSDYDCPANDFVYLVAVGGNPGISGTANNLAIKEMTALYPCSSLTADSYVEINEVTTVASVTALRGFIDPVTGAVATSPSNVQGLTNGFVTASLLVDMSSGVANTATPSGLGIVPAAEINTLADVLAACVNSGSGDTSCSTLFSAAKPPKGATPVDTLQAMIDIATNPGQNVATLYGLVTATPPFTPTLPNGQPGDWTMAIVYTSGTLPSAPLTFVSYLAIDSKNNIWAVNGGNALQLSNAGEVNYLVVDPRIQSNNGNQVLAVDEADSLWVDDNSYSTTKITSTGTIFCSGDVYCLIPGAGTNTANGFLGQNYLGGFGGVAIQPSTGDPWFGSQNATTGVAQVDQNGDGLNDYLGRGINAPTSLAFDQAGDLWVANNGGVAGASVNTVVKVAPDGTSLSGTSGFSGGGLDAPFAVAIDGTGDAWVANIAGASLTRLSSLGIPDANSPYTGGGLNGPSDIAIDGAGNLWVSNNYGSGVSKFDGITGAAISPALVGYFTGATTYAQCGSVAVDGSGNVWLSCWADNTVNELVGAGAPTVVPLVTATKNDAIGTMP